MAASIEEQSREKFQNFQKTLLLADTGDDAHAQFCVGKEYYCGGVVPIDYALCIKYTDLAAKIFEPLKSWRSKMYPLAVQFENSTAEQPQHLLQGLHQQGHLLRVHTEPSEVTAYARGLSNELPKPILPSNEPIWSGTTFGNWV